MFTYCNNNPIMLEDPSGTAGFWSNLKEFGKNMIKVATITATIAAIVGAAAFIAAGTIMSGGAGAVAIPAVVALASVMLEACITTAAIGVATVKVGEIGEGINYMATRNNSHNNPKSKGTPKNNQVQNKQVDDIVNKLGLNKYQRRLLHEEISGQGYDYHEIFEIAKEMFGK